MCSILGIIEKIQRIPCHQNHQIKERYVCSPTSHFTSQGYNCGFRNLQMLLSCLIKDAAYLHRVFSGTCGFWLQLEVEIKGLYRVRHFPFSLASKVQANYWWDQRFMACPISVFCPSLSLTPNIAVPHGFCTIFIHRPNECRPLIKMVVCCD